MYAQVEKPKENKSRAVANSVAQKKSGMKQGFVFVDKRPEAIAQRKLQEMANISSKVEQQRGIQKTDKLSNSVQLKSALGMAGLGNAAGDADLYNIAGGVNLPQGTVFTEQLPVAADVDTAIDRYIGRATVIGTAMAAEEFLDKNSQPPDVPNAHNFANPGHVFHNNFETWARLAPGSSHAMARPAALIMRNNLMKNARVNSRNNAAIGLIDPFITRISIPQQHAGNWIFETNWSEAANSYITKVRVGSKNLTGKIKDAGNYHTVKEGVRLILRYKFGKMTVDEKCPEMLPAIA